MICIGIPFLAPLIWTEPVGAESDDPAPEESPADPLDETLQDAELLEPGVGSPPSVEDDLDQPEPFEPLDPKELNLSDPVPVRSGPFRVGNRTPFPLRLVTLRRSGGGILSPERAHWDFAPGEGGREGLLLSLGEDPLALSTGDVVVAFTLDGTGRYWGPFVAGSTPYPDWDPDVEVWLLPLPPEALGEVSNSAPPQADQTQVNQSVDQRQAGADQGIAGNLAGSLAPVHGTNPAGNGQVGAFRVGNRTDHPIRVTVLLRGELGQDPQVVHWDFAPEEGGAEGLPLSLGEELVMLRPGDVVVAFTTDGGRQYWGPSVVGESMLPFWDPTVGVWSTILQP